LQEISKLLLSNKLEEGWFQRVPSILVEKIHCIRGNLYVERKVFAGLALLHVCFVVSGGLAAGRNSGISAFHFVVVQFDALKGNHNVPNLTFIQTRTKLEEHILAPEYPRIFRT
jgi:hypothetical protein